ncbi:hypothetical protein [Marinomonas ostreistagni]|uniref:hypothetical protein n=1 Tax=Marinomonas ostreistagni TaxID=359209 RepID=UPI00194FA5F5|nr:hypothetical protein [Marinomonas ostreistagni]MBM6551353.1 hypothetical protein [Marinomonas ostreistagni]
MKTLTALTNTVSFAKKGTLAAAIAAASMTGSMAYADYDGDGCMMIDQQEVALEQAKADNDWSAIFDAQMELSTAKAECWITKNMTEENTEEEWAEIKADFQAGMEDIKAEYDEQVADAKQEFEEAKEAANTDEKLEAAEEKYHETMEDLQESYNESIESLKDSLKIED